MKTLLSSIFIAMAGFSAPAAAQNTALLLFDGSTGTQFAGCLNCNQFDAGAVCNQFGDYGSQFSDTSIWNQFGKFGSAFEENSPWSRFGEGLRVVDEGGNYYGRFSLSTFDQSRVPLVRDLLRAHEAMGDLNALRNLLCE